MDYTSKFEAFKEMDLSLDLTRGKPSADQLDLSNSLVKYDENDLILNGLDLRNYGEIKGLSLIHI